MTDIVIAGFGPNDNVPGSVTSVKYGVGGANPGQTTYQMLIVAPKASGGTAVEDSEIFPIPNLDAAAVKAGQGSELWLGAQVGLKRKISLFGICPSLSSPTQATLTVTITGTWTTAGSWSLRIAGVTIGGGITASQTKVNVAASITAVIAANPNLGCVALQGTSVGTNDNTTVLTWKTPGVRGNQAIAWTVNTDLPAGATIALTGGTAVTGGGVPFSGGAATEDITTLLNVIGRGWYNYIAGAQNDATNLGRWRAWLDGQAAPFVEKPSFHGFATNGTLTAMGSLAQNTCNDPFMQAVWMLNAESHPTALASAMMALRCESEQSQPNTNYDDMELLGIAPTADPAIADIPDRPTKQTAADEGVTSLYTDVDGRVLITRAITTLSRNGSVPYYGTLDVAKAVVPQVIRARLKARWAPFKAANPYLRDEPSKSEPTPPQKVATPSRWNGEIANELIIAEADLLLVDTQLNPPRTQYDPVAVRFMSEVPTKVLDQQHQVGISILQLVA